MKNMQRLLLLAAGITLSSGASAQSAADARYCDKLIGLYRVYINNPEESKPHYQTPLASQEAAIANCKTGNTAAGIPVLEQVLRNNKFTLPARGES